MNGRLLSGSRIRPVNGRDWAGAEWPLRGGVDPIIDAQATVAVSRKRSFIHDPNLGLGLGRKSMLALGSIMRLGFRGDALVSNSAWRHSRWREPSAL